MVGNFAEIFKDWSKLEPDYVPEELVGREGKYRELVRLFKPVLEDGASQRVLVHGPGGSGKTALAFPPRARIHPRGFTSYRMRVPPQARGGTLPLGDCLPHLCLQLR